MNVHLTPELEQLVHNKVQTGRYNSASEVVREALRLLEEHEQARAAQLGEFNKELGRRLHACVKDQGGFATAERRPVGNEHFVTDVGQVGGPLFAARLDD